MLKIQEFISCFDDVFNAYIYLKRNLNIDVSLHTLENKDDKYGMALFKPSAKADMTNPIVQEANCLILGEDGDLLAVVLREARRHVELGVVVLDTHERLQRFLGAREEQRKQVVCGFAVDAQHLPPDALAGFQLADATL